MVVQLKGVVDCRVSSRVGVATALVSGVVAYHRAVRCGQQVGAVVAVAHLEYVRLAHHTESGDTEGMTFRQPEVESCAGEETAAAVGLHTFLYQVALDQRTVQRLTSFAGEVIPVGLATAVADVIPVAYVEIAVHRTGIEIDVKTEVGAWRYVPWLCQRVVHSSLNGTVVTRRAVFFHHQVDDAGCPFGAELSRRVGNYFNLLDCAGRHLLQHLPPVLAVQSGRLAVDPYLYILAVAQRDRTFLINVHRRDIL